MNENQRCSRCGGALWDADERDAGIHSSCDVTDRTMLLQLCASMTLAEHSGDIADDVYKVLFWAGVVVEASDGDWQSDVQKALHRMGIGTVYGSSVGDEEEPTHQSEQGGEG